MSNENIKALAKEIRAIKRQVADISKPRLGFSSLEDGEGIEQYVDEILRQRFGHQWDGTTAPVQFNGPTPPVPNLPGVDPMIGGLRIWWDGTFVDGAVSPMDFSRVLLYAVTDPESFNPFDSTQIFGEINSPAGGEVFASLPPVEHFVFAVAWTTSGKFAVQPTPSMGTPRKVAQSDLGFEFEFETPDAPESVEVELTGMPRGILVQVPNAEPSWRFDITVIDQDSGVQNYDNVSMPYYIEDGLLPGEDYTFEVRAHNVSGEAFSEEVVGRLNLNDSDTITSLATDKLIAGDLVGGYALLGALQVGAAISVSTVDGIRITLADGGRIHFPSDGSPATITAWAELYGLTVRGGMVVRGVTNEISPGASVTLSSGISAPQQPPSLGIGHDHLQTGLSQAFGSIYYGLTAGRTSNTLATAIGFFGSGVREISTTTGAVNNFIDTSSWNDDMQAFGGIVKVGGQFFVLGPNLGGPKDGVWHIYKLNGEYQKISAWDVGIVNMPDGAVIGTDGTNVLVAWVATNGDLRYKGFDTNGSQVIDHTTLASAIPPTRRRLAGIYKGAADFGLSKIVVSTRSGNMYQFLSSNLDPNNTHLWQPPVAAEALKGFHWDGTRFLHLDDAMKVWRYEVGRTTSVQRSVNYSWFDSDPAGTGQHETPRGEAATGWHYARSKLVVTTGAPNDTGEPDAPDSVRIWIDGWRQPDLGPGVITQSYSTISTGVASKAPDFATSGLTAAKILAARNGFSIDGNSNGSVGTGSFRDSIKAVARGEYIVLRTDLSTGNDGVATFTHNLGEIPLGIFFTQMGKQNTPINFVTLYQWWGEQTAQVKLLVGSDLNTPLANDTVSVAIRIERP